MTLFRRPKRDCNWLLADKENYGNITPGNFICASDSTEFSDIKYNCIAWAVGKNDEFWWPRKLGGYFWPEGLLSEPLNRETVENFIKAFESEGFQKCDGPEFEEGFEKIALYVNHLEIPKHAARSLPNGNWTSKMGDGEDITHGTLEAIEGRGCGKAKYFLKRNNPECKKAIHPKT